MNIAVFLPNWIGDVVMATPALRALRRQFGPPARMIGVMRPHVADVLSGTNWLDEQLLYHPKATQRHLGMWRLVRDLRHRSIDLAVLFPGSLRAALLAWLGGARQRLGYDVRGRGLLLTQRVVPLQLRGSLLPISTIDVYLELAYQAGCPPQSRQTELATLPHDERRADDVLRALGLRQREPMVVFNPSGGGNSETSVRAWPAENFAELGRRIVASHPAHVLVLCGPREETMARQIVRLAGHDRVHSLADHPVGIGPLKACVRRSELMVTTDTGPRHFAAAFDVPHIALCGPIPASWSNNYHPREIHLATKVPCGPCGKRYCQPGHHRCMREITVDRVFDAVQRQLAENREPSSGRDGPTTLPQRAFLQGSG